MRSIGLRDDLERAIRERQFELHYQPIVNLETGDLTGVEALARWRHPSRGLLGPGDFIGVAEATGTIITLGQWIFTESCRQAAAWADGPLAGGRFMSINLSTIQITYPGFVEFVTDAVARTGVDPSHLLVEVTESANPDPDSVSSALLRLHALGIRLAVDDFGVGYSSLSRLLRTPVDAVKIDQSFIHGIGEKDGRTLVRAIVSMAHALRLDVTAEGNSVRVTYSGTVEKDTMKGTVKFGDLGEGTFTGTRKR